MKLSLGEFAQIGLCSILGLILAYLFARVVTAGVLFSVQKMKGTKDGEEKK